MLWNTCLHWKIGNFQFHTLTFLSISPVIPPNYFMHLRHICMFNTNRKYEIPTTKPKINIITYAVIFNVYPLNWMLEKICPSLSKRNYSMDSICLSQDDVRLPSITKTLASFRLIVLHQLATIWPITCIWKLMCERSWRFTIQRNVYSHKKERFTGQYV